MQIGSQTPALVTGGASGLGEATARALAAKGAKVAILDLNEEAGRAVAEQIGGAFQRCDVTSDDSVDAALDAAETAHGPARILVNCAGVAPAMKTVGRDGPHDMAKFEAALRINLAGTMRVMSRASARMGALAALEGGQRGAVVNVASVAAFEGQIGQAAYGASKGGVAALTLPAARDLARSGVRVNAIAPGLFLTPMLRGLPQEAQDSLAQQPLFPQRLGDPAEFASLAVFLIETDYMNATVVRIDAGIRMAAK